MRYDPESYDMLRAFHLCTRCGERTSVKPDGDYYALCDGCRQRMSDNRGKKEASDTICWHCRNAVPDPVKGIGCEWSIRLKPVPGWEADYLPMKTLGKIIDSYRVRKCPKFKKG